MCVTVSVSPTTNRHPRRSNYARNSDCIIKALSSGRGKLQQAHIATFLIGFMDAHEYANFDVLH